MVFVGTRNSPDATRSHRSASDTRDATASGSARCTSRMRDRWQPTSSRRYSLRIVRCPGSAKAVAHAMCGMVSAWSRASSVSSASKRVEQLSRLCGSLHIPWLSLTKCGTGASGRRSNGCRLSARSDAQPRSIARAARWQHRCLQDLRTP
eukprot:85204-Prymnesium_polylepis.2